MDNEEQQKNVEVTLQELKKSGVECALIRKDGLLITSTLTLDETMPNLVASIANITDELMHWASDKQKEVEISVGGIFFVIVPFGNYFLCGAVKDREIKKELRAAAEQLKQII